MISYHHNNLLYGHFGIKKTCKLLAQKYYCPTVRHNVKAYVKDCDVGLASKAVRHKPYNNLQLLLIPMHQSKNNGFCDRSTNFNQLEKRQLWLHSSHYWLAHKDGPLQTGQDYHQCIQACRRYNKRHSTLSCPSELNSYRSRLPIYLEILVIALPLFWHQASTFYHLPFVNWRPN